MLDHDAEKLAGIGKLSREIMDFLVWRANLGDTLPHPQTEKLLVILRPASSWFTEIVRLAQVWDLDVSI